MSNKRKWKVSKIEFIGLLFVIALVGMLGVSYVTNNNFSFKGYEKYETSYLQKIVDKYYYDNVQFPSRFQPTIGFPVKIDVNVLGKHNLPNYSNELVYMVDAYGEVYSLNKDFSPPKNVDIIVDKEGKTYMRWSVVDKADSYGVREVTNDNTAMMNKAFGKVTASLLNVTSKGKVIEERQSEEFQREGNYILYEIKNYNPKSIYVVYAVNNELGETPGVGRGYTE